MSDTPGEARVRIEAATERRRDALAAPLGAPTATGASEAESESRAVEGIRATPT